MSFGQRDYDRTKPEIDAPQGPAPADLVVRDLIEGEIDDSAEGGGDGTITLVDTLYEARVKLLASAAADAPDLYKARDGREAFEFDRTVSRLMEMQSADYLAEGHGLRV